MDQPKDDLSDRDVNAPLGTTSPDDAADVHEYEHKRMSLINQELEAHGIDARPTISAVLAAVRKYHDRHRRTLHVARGSASQAAALSRLRRFSDHSMRLRGRLCAPWLQAGLGPFARQRPSATVIV